MYNLPSVQRKQLEWTWQWEKFYDDNQWLFFDWIWPNTLEDFRGKDVLDCGCGGGQHLRIIAPYCASAVGVDLNAIDSARKHTTHLAKISLYEADIAEMDLGRSFDIVYSIGVLHHTDDPDRAFRNIVKHCKPGGRVIVWVYSYEGNFLNRTALEWTKRRLVFKLPRRTVWAVSWLLTTLLYMPIYTVYLLPRMHLPFDGYFSNWRKLSYRRNLLNVFDKLNAPQTWFITEQKIRGWFSPEQFTDVHISRYKGVSWRGSGTKRGYVS
jgi:SAM-dependent methyltransferase